MPKDSLSFTDSRNLIAVRKLPEKREVFIGRVAQAPSRWPFKAAGAYGVPSLLPAETGPVPHQVRSSFIT